MSNNICEICFCDNVNRIKIRVGLEYLICRLCGHAVQLNDKKSMEKIYAESQMEYYGTSTDLLIKSKGDYSDNSIKLRPTFNSFDLERKKNYQNLFNRFIGSPSKVLEVGIGDGDFSKWLCSCGHNVSVIEESKKLGQSLKEQTSLISVIIDDFEHCSIPDESFDVFCSFHVLEHVLDPVSFLTKAFHSTRVGGLAFIASPNSTSWQQRFFRRLSPNYDSAHLRVFSQHSLKKIAENTGWRVILEKTPEYTSNWLRVLSKILRKIRGEDEEKTAGKYINYYWGKSFYFCIKILQFVTFPLRFIQQYLYGGNEIFIVLRRE